MRLCAALALPAVLVATAGDALADGWPSLEPLGDAFVQAFANLNFHSQLQLGAAGVLASGPRPGGAEARATVNALGFGLMVGGRYEPYPTGGGGLGMLALEFRPLPFLENNLYRLIDPYMTVGGEIGGGSVGFRASQTIGAGVDIGLFSEPFENHENVHPAITILYQYRVVQTPADLPKHLLHLGGAFRVVF